MKFKALSTGSITDKDGETHRFYKGEIVDIKKKDFDFDPDEHGNFERAKKD